MNNGDASFRPMTQSPPIRAGSSMGISSSNGYPYDGTFSLPKTSNANRNIKINQNTMENVASAQPQIF